MSVPALAYDGTRFPIDPEAPLLPQCDPLVTPLLSLLSGAINRYLGDACRAAFGRPGVAAVTTLSPDRWLLARTHALPLLALYATGGSADREATLTRTSHTTTYRLEYVLPQLSTEQAERAECLLLAARKLISAVVYRQGDAGHEAHRTVLIDAGIARLDLGEWQVGAATVGQGNTDATVSVLSMSLTAHRELGYLDDPYNALDARNLQIDSAEVGSTTLNNLVSVTVT